MGDGCVLNATYARMCLFLVGGENEGGKYGLHEGRSVYLSTKTFVANARVMVCVVPIPVGAVPCQVLILLVV